jgi:hypothetical protein
MASQAFGSVVERGLSSPQQLWNAQRFRKILQRRSFHIAADWKVDWKVRAPFLTPPIPRLPAKTERDTKPWPLTPEPEK